MARPVLVSHDIELLAKRLNVNTGGKKTASLSALILPTTKRERAKFDAPADYRKAIRAEYGIPFGVVDVLSALLKTGKFPAAKEVVAALNNGKRYPAGALAYRVKAFLANPSDASEELPKFLTCMEAVEK